MPANKKPVKSKAGSARSSDTAQSGFAKADSVISRKNRNGTVILMRLDKASSFYKLDGIAAEVWSCFEAPKSMAAVVDYFGERYPAKAKTIHKDIDGLVKKLVKSELLASSKGPFGKIPASTEKKAAEFGKVQEFDLEQIEAEVLNESVYLDVFAGSDLRLKTHVSPIEGALSKVTQLDGITHRWKDRGGVHAGLVAQQVAEHMPELVRKDTETGVLAVNYQKLSSYLVEAIKDLSHQNQAQEARIRKLEARLS
jgi:hypothetical protein